MFRPRKQDLRDRKEYKLPTLILFGDSHYITEQHSDSLKNSRTLYYVTQRNSIKLWKSPFLLEGRPTLFWGLVEN